MPAIILKILGPLAPYLAAGGALLGLALYIMTLRHDLSNAAAQNLALTQTNQADAAAIADYKAQQAQWNEAAARLEARTRAADDAASRIMDGIASAPPGQNAPVAPVLAQALNSLRTLQGAAP